MFGIINAPTLSKKESLLPVDNGEFSVSLKTSYFCRFEPMMVSKHQGSLDVDMSVLFTSVLYFNKILFQPITFETADLPEILKRPSLSRGFTMLHQECNPG